MSKNNCGRKKAKKMNKEKKLHETGEFREKLKNESPDFKQFIKTKYQMDKF